MAAFQGLVDKLLALQMRRVQLLTKQLQAKLLRSVLTGLLFVAILLLALADLAGDASSLKPGHDDSPAGEHLPEEIRCSATIDFVIASVFRCHAGFPEF